MAEYKVIMVTYARGEVIYMDYDVEANNDSTAIEIGRGLLAEDFEVDPDRVETYFIERPKGKICKAYKIIVESKDIDGSINNWDYDIEAETDNAAISLAKGMFARDKEVSPSKVGITYIRSESIENRDARLEKERKEELEREKAYQKREEELNRTDLGRIIKNMDVDSQRERLLEHFKNNRPVNLKDFVLKEFQELKSWFLESLGRNIDSRDEYHKSWKMITNGDARIDKGKVEEIYYRSLESGIDKLKEFVTGRFMEKYLVSCFNLGPLGGNPYKGDVTKDIFSKLDEWSNPEIKAITDCIGDSNTKSFIEMDNKKITYRKEGFLGSKSYALFEYSFTIEEHLLKLLKLLVDPEIRHVSVVYCFKSNSDADERKLIERYMYVEVPVDLNDKSTFSGNNTIFLPGNLSGRIAFSSVFSRESGAFLAVIRNR